MEKKNYVFIATSIDGYIADKDGGVQFLNSVPNPDNNNIGYSSFVKGMDALIMGRSTFEFLLTFDMDWPYDIPVFVLSTTLTKVPKFLNGKVEIVNGSLQEVLSIIHAKGFNKLYIDGGKTVQSFLKEDLVDELIISKIPVLLGGGIPLFGELSQQMNFTHLKTEVFLDEIVQIHYQRKK